MDKLEGKMSDFMRDNNLDGESKGSGSLLEQMQEMNGYRLFMQKYPDIDSYTIFSNQNRILQMAREFNNCGLCMSLGSCKNSLSGYYYGLDVKHRENDDTWQITEIMKPCRKYGKSC